MGRIASWLGRVLNAVPPEELDGLQLDGPYWEVATRRADQAEFFRALAALVPEESFLVLEGGAHPPALQDLLATHAVQPETKIARGTVWPRATVFHVQASTAILGEVAEVAEKSAAPELCYHLNVYDREGVLLQWYDAFSDPLYVSKRVPVERLEAFCRRLNTSFKDA
jgi:hypothetical protein